MPDTMLLMKANCYYGEGDMTDLSSSMQNYLKTIYSEGAGNNGVRVGDLAREMDYTKASVSAAVKKLERQGLVKRDDERLVYLTEAGEDEAIRILGKRNLIQRFLMQDLNVSDQIAEQDAESIEYVISRSTLCAICRYPNRSKPAASCAGICPIHQTNQ